MAPARFTVVAAVTAAVLSFVTDSYAQLPDGQIKVMSYNWQCEGCHNWEGRRGKFADFFKSEWPDSVGSQEPSGKMLSEVSTMLNKKYLYVGRGRDGGDRGEYSAIMYNANKWFVAKSDTFQLSAQPDSPGSNTFNLQYTRVCTYAKLCLYSDNGICYYHFNAHYDFSHIEDLTRIIVDRLCKEVEGGCPNFVYPVFFTADMNAAQGNAGLGIFQQRAGLTDTWLTRHGNYANSQTMGGAKIDFVLASRNVRIGETEVLRRYRDMSDHQPLYALACVDNSCFATPSTPAPTPAATTPSPTTITPSTDPSQLVSITLAPSGANEVLENINGTAEDTNIPLEGPVAQVDGSGEVTSETSDFDSSANEGVSVGSTIGFVFLGMISVVVIVGVVVQRHRIPEFLARKSSSSCEDDEDISTCVTPESALSPGFRRYQREL